MITPSSRSSVPIISGEDKHIGENVLSSETMSMWGFNLQIWSIRCYLLSHYTSTRREAGKKTEDSADL